MTLQQNKQVLNGDCIHKPQIDTYNYRYFVLNNGLKCMLVNDPEADKAAACLDVQIGSLHEDEDVPGLAHFLEHMLFFASEKYPKEDEYSQFVSDHGGYSNAYTADDHTNYHFCVNWDHLEGALDRFACFFTCPLISKDGVDREINAVDSENSKNLMTDAWRQQQTWRDTANPQHPWSRFHVGNILTLKIEGIHEKVNDFYKRQYSPGLMNLVVFGRQSLDVLQSMVIQMFSDIEHKKLQPNNISENLWTQQQQSKLIKVVPQKVGHMLHMQWLLPALWPFQKEGPGHYVSHLIGHEGEGSVFELLKTLGWAQSLVAGESGLSCRCASIFVVSIELTEIGHQNVDKILGIVFSYLEMLRGAEGVQERIFNENKKLQELGYNFREKVSAVNYVDQLACQLSISKPQDVIQAIYGVSQVFDEECIRRSVLDRLKPEFVRLMWVSKDFSGQTDKMEKWYQQAYWIGDIPEDWMTLWKQEDPKAELNNFKAKLHLPHPNPFVPSDFTMHLADTQTLEPKVVHESSFLKMWAKPEVQFNIPKASIVLLFMSPHISNSPKNVVLLDLLARLVNDYLNSVTYSADLAGLYFNVIALEAGLRISVKGYNDKLLVLLNLVLDELAKFKVKKDRFEIVLEKLSKEVNNKDMAQPYQLAYMKTDYLLGYAKYEYPAIKSFLDNNTVSATDLDSFFANQLTKKCEVEGLVAGNITTKFVQDIYEAVEQRVGKVWNEVVAPNDDEKLKFGHVKLLEGQRYLYLKDVPNLENENSAVVVLFQIAEQDNMKLNALAQLLVQIGERHVFHELRTVEQLGYIVTLMYSQDRGVPSMRFIIQSSQYTSTYLHHRINHFIQKFAKLIEELEDTEFEEAISELSKAKLEKPKKLGTLVQRWYSEIVYNTLKFERPTEEVKYLKQLSKQQLLDFMKTYMLSPGNIRQLSVHFIGSTERKQNQEKSAEELQDSAIIDNDFANEQEQFISLR